MLAGRATCDRDLVLPPDRRAALGAQLSRGCQREAMGRAEMCELVRLREACSATRSYSWPPPVPSTGKDGVRGGGAEGSRGRPSPPLRPQRSWLISNGCTAKA